MTTQPQRADLGGREWFPGLNALRALGALGVVATHVGFQTARTVQGDWAATIARLDVGVALFFSLSGFLLSLPYLRAASGHPTPDLRNYLSKRALRILPAYWLVVVTALLVLGANGDAGPVDWVRQLSLTQIYGSGWQFHGLTQTWSLCTEVAFYLLLPVIGGRWLARRRPDARLASLTLLAGIAITITWLLSLGAQHGRLDLRVAGQWLPAYASWFAVGIALAVLHEHLRTASATRLRWLESLASAPWSCWAVSAGAFLLATTPVAGPRSLEAVATPNQAITKNLLYAVVAAFLLLPFVIGSGRPGRLGRVLATRPLFLLGEISYGIFLWHLLVLECVVQVRDQALFTGGFVSTFLITVAVTVAVATACYVLVERPAMRLRGRLRPRRAKRNGRLVDTNETATTAASWAPDPSPR